MKKLVAIATAFVLSIVALAGCGSQGTQPASSANAKKSIVCATFPAYDWVRAVAGDHADDYDITYLMDSGVDLHSYSPTVDEVAKISQADLFIYVGGESDGWARDAVEAAKNPNMHAISMLDTVGDAAVEEEVVEGMQAEEHEHEHAEGEGEEHEYDEHVWLSLRNAKVIVNEIAKQLGEIDSANSADIKANAEAYGKKLDALDARYEEAVAAAKKKAVVFADRFPFRYLTDDYDLTYYAAFVGCSAETEASFETVAFLAKKIDELGLSNVLVIEGSDQAIAKTVIENTKDKNQKIQVMDSLQSTSADDVQAGKTYLDTMEKNLDTLTVALS